MAINPVGINPVNLAPSTKSNVEFTGFMDKVVSSKGFESVAKFAAEKPAVFNAASSLVLCSVLRPATILALPGKGEDAKKNKMTAAAHAISSGIMGFLITSIAMKPISAGLKKVMADTDKYLPKLSEKMKTNPQTAAAVNKVLSFGPDILLAIPRALLTSKCTGFIMKNVFGKGKEKAAEKAAPQAQAQPQVAEAVTERPVLDNFKGGSK